HLRVGLAAGEPREARAAVEEAAGGAPEVGAELGGGLFVYALAVQDDAVVAEGAGDGHLAVADVGRHSAGVAVVRGAPAAAARGADADDLARLDRVVIDQALHLLAVDLHPEGTPGESAVDAPAGQDGPVGDGHVGGVAQHPDVLVVAEAAAVHAGPAGVAGQAEPLDPERPAGLGELDGDVARVGHDVDGVLAVGVPAAA